MSRNIELLRNCAPIYEISSQSTIAGRRHIKVILHEIFPDTAHYQENGISWDETYVLNNLQSVAGMSIVVEFLTEDREAPYGHGMTAIRDNMPLFEDATMVGHFEKAYIDDVEIDGSTKRVLIAEGILDEMRYPKFVAWLREHMAEGVVKGSVEIVGKPENHGKIIYSGGWKEKGRVPQIYDYSGYAILGVKPADEAAIIMELNNRKTEQEEHDMDEKLKGELMAAVSSTLSETNTKWSNYLAKMEAKQVEISQLQAEIQAKSEENAKLQASVEASEAKKDAAEKERDEEKGRAKEAEDKLAEANAKIAELEGEKEKAELNAALASYSDEQRKFAEAEINAFNENPGSVEINAIIGKICTEMVKAVRESKVSETNAASGIDIFSMIDDGKQQDDDGEVDVF